MQVTDLKVVDRLGLIDSEIKKLEEQKAELRAILIGELVPKDGGKLEGDLFVATVKNSARVYFDRELLEKYVEQKILRKCEKVTSCVTVSVKRK